MSIMANPFTSQLDLELARQSLLFSFREIVSELTAVIGKKLTPYIAGTKETCVIDCWITGAQPGADIEERIRFAYPLVMTLRLNETPEVVQAWLVGVNPELGDRAAIRILRGDPLDVAGPSLLEAAKALASGG